MKAKTFLVASAAALLMMSGAVAARADESAGSRQVKCIDVNSCRGHGACAAARNDCKGKNGGKGQGIVELGIAKACTSPCGDHNDRSGGAQEKLTSTHGSR